jgi:cation diffusion facilitator family transporter
MAAQGESKTAVVAAVVGNLTIAVIKLIAASLTKSSAMIAEGIHSLVDTGNGGLVLLGMRRSAEPADRAHPFGHGKELYFWTLIVAISIFGIGGGMSVYEGVSHIRHPSPLENPMANYVVLAISAVVEGTSFFIAMRQFRRAKGTQKTWGFIRSAKDPSLFTVVFEDSAAMLGLVVAFLGVLLGHLFENPYFDGGASIVIGLILMTVAWGLARESKGLLIGEGAEPELLERLRATVESDPDVQAVGMIRTMYLGPEDLLVNLDVAFRPTLHAPGVHTAIDRIEAALKSQDPAIRRIYIELDSVKDLVAAETPTEA